MRLRGEAKLDGVGEAPSRLDLPAVVRGKRACRGFAGVLAARRRYTGDLASADHMQCWRREKALVGVSGMGGQSVLPQLAGAEARSPYEGGTDSCKMGNKRKMRRRKSVLKLPQLVDASRGTEYFATARPLRLPPSLAPHQSPGIRLPCVTVEGGVSSQLMHAASTSSPSPSNRKSRQTRTCKPSSRPIPILHKQNPDTLNSLLVTGQNCSLPTTPQGTSTTEWPPLCPTILLHHEHRDMSVNSQVCLPSLLQPPQPLGRRRASDSDWLSLQQFNSRKNGALSMALVDVGSFFFAPVEIHRGFARLKRLRTIPGKQGGAHSNIKGVSRSEFQKLPKLSPSFQLIKNHLAIGNLDARYLQSLLELTGSRERQKSHSPSASRARMRRGLRLKQHPRQGLGPPDTFWQRGAGLQLELVGSSIAGAAAMGTGPDREEGYLLHGG